MDHDTCRFDPVRYVPFPGLVRDAATDEVLRSATRDERAAYLAAVERRQPFFVADWPKPVWIDTDERPLVL